MNWFVLLNNLFIEFIIFMYKFYSMVEIKFLCIVSYLFDIYYSDYYKVNYFYQNKIQPYYISKDLIMEDSLPSINYDMVVWENNKICVVIHNDKEYKDLIVKINTLQDIYQKTPFLPEYPLNLFQYCKYTFSLIVLEIDNFEYEIKLKQNYYNYYIVNNKITYSFVLYYANKYLQIKTPIDDYNIQFIDHKSNYVTNITKKDVIVLNLNDYKIIKDNE